MLADALLPMHHISPNDPSKILKEAGSTFSADRGRLHAAGSTGSWCSVVLSQGFLVFRTPCFTYCTIRCSDERKTCARIWGSPPQSPRKALQISNQDEPARKNVPGSTWVATKSRCPKIERDMINSKRDHTLGHSWQYLIWISCEDNHNLLCSNSHFRGSNCFCSECSALTAKGCVWCWRQQPRLVCPLPPDLRGKNSTKDVAEKPVCTASSANLFMYSLIIALSRIFLLFVHQIVLFSYIFESEKSSTNTAKPKWHSMT